MTDLAQSLIPALLPAIVALSVISLLLFIYGRSKALLQYFQQEEYDGGRFLRWIAATRAFDKRATLVVMAGLVVRSQYGSDTGILGAHIIMISGFLWGAQISLEHLRKAKKPLVMTTRARRILVVANILFIVGAIAVNQIAFAISETASIALIVLSLQLPPILLTLGNLALSPVESRVKRRLIGEAHHKLAQLKPTVIAITGSYGKTSTKHILAHILSAGAPTLATPGSVNTEMGITRIIRENLTARHKYLIVEMGAYGPGSIKKLCALTPPDMGIITGVGVAHLERFGDEATVFNAKFELADALEDRDGKIIINRATLPPALLAARLSTARDNYIIADWGRDVDTLNIAIDDVEQRPEGLRIPLWFKIDGESGFGEGRDGLFIEAPVYGLHQAENIALAVGAARQLGIPDSTIAATLKSLPQTRHRLEFLKSATGPSVLDDAYNSNPAGFRQALETLSMLAPKPAKRLLITPGMVELGDAHDAQHYALGQLAGKLVDVAAVVMPARIESFLKGFRESAPEGTLLRTFEAQDEAENWVKSLAGTGDVILFENNLPDLFENPPKF
jgi:UDP-N-acetylmuramoyl-tripeptide--D-alanyl-D-alanine ligase